MAGPTPDGNSGNPPSELDSPTTSAGFETDQLPHLSHISDNYPDEDEAAVDPHIVHDEPDPDEEEEGEDLYHDNFLDDYRRMDDHDQYESLGLDDSLEDERDLDQIMEGQASCRDRTGHSRCSVHPSGRFLSYYMIKTRRMTITGPSKRARADFRPPAAARSYDDIDDHSVDDQYEDEDDDENENEMYRVQGPLREHVTMDAVRRCYVKKFKKFLETYVNPKSGNGELEYMRLINEMVLANRCSLEIDYKQFIFVHPNIAIWLADAPQPVLEVMEDVAKKVVFDIHPNYKNIHQKIYVRINNLPVYDQIRNIRQIHLNTMIRNWGVVKPDALGLPPVAAGEV
ncbi:DNA replication licensing factor MCM2, partial [Cucurbita argyrosperma subsp. sororia]